MISERLLSFVADFEGFRARAYKCPAGVCTIGYGETDGVKMGDVTTEPAAREQLRKRLDGFQARVLELAGTRTTGAQGDAMSSLAYNIGLDAFRHSTVLRMHKAGRYDDAARAFGMWNKVHGKPLAGLTRRRAAEASMYRGA
jgi:lysozyme